MSVLKTLTPSNVFFYFEQICNIPHGSGNTKAISDYCIAFAKQYHLSYHQDQLGNVLIKKNGTTGYENSKPVIIQGHLDMVCEKDDFLTQADMQTDGLQLQVEGDYIFAKGTTLGGDDGIAVAYALAILADTTLKHPPLEIVLTVDEEVGLLGAQGMELSDCKSKRLINIDSEEEGCFLTSCAGGITAVCSLPISYEECTGEVICVTIDGLIGGHSGIEIDKNRGNSNKLMARLLYRISKKHKITICELSGGAKDNAIPLITKVKFIANILDIDEILCSIDSICTDFKNELKTSDNKVNVSATKQGIDTVKCITLADTNNLINWLLSLPNGIQTMSADVSGLVQSSLNLGILKLENNNVVASFSVRSSLDSLKTEQLERLESLTVSFGGKLETKGDYPAWEYQKNSVLRTAFCTAYEKLFKKIATLQAIHAGLECGIFCGKIDNLDCISFGPNMYDIHTSKEKLSISSAQKMYQLLVYVLENLK